MPNAGAFANDNVGNLRADFCARWLANGFLLLMWRDAESVEQSMLMTADAASELEIVLAQARTMANQCLI